MMERDYLDIIKEKEFIELNSDEKAEVLEICATEDEFNAMKSMLLQIDTVAAEPILPKEETKKSLDDLFAQTYPKVTPVWYNSVFAVIVPKEKPIYRQPLVQIAAAFLIFWMVFPFFNEPLKPEAKQLAKVEVKGAEQPVEEVKEEEIESNNQQDELIPNVEQNQIQDETITTSENVMTRSIATNTPAPLAESESDVVAFSMDEFAEAEESTHPDGIFMGAADRTVAFAQSGSETQDLLDLLTPTF